MQTEGSIEIDRSIDEVFDYTMSNIVEWSTMVVEDRVIEGDGGVGTTFLNVTEDRGRRMEFQGTVTKHDPPKLSTVRLEGAQFDIEAEYTFESLSGDRTRVTQSSTAQGKGFTKILMALMGWMMKSSGCKALENELESLKRHCEARGRGET